MSTRLAVTSKRISSRVLLASLFCSWRSLARGLLPAVSALVLAACAGATPLPEEHYYRLAIEAPAASATAPKPALSGNIVVENLHASGIYTERAIVYSEDANHLSLEHYHYQFWTDTPPRLLQDELIRYTRAAIPGSMVMAETGRTNPDYRISGAVRRFERVKLDKGWQAAVALEFRVDKVDASEPLLVHDYEQIVPATDGSMEATVQAFSSATSAVFRQFSADVAKIGTESGKDTAQ